MTGSTHVCAGASLMLCELLLHGSEERCIDDGRNRQGNPILWWNGVPAGGLARVGALTAQGPERLALPGAAARPARGRFALVGRMVEQGPDRATVPARLARVGRDTRLRQAARYLPNGAAVAPDPLK